MNSRKWLLLLAVLSAGCAALPRELRFQVAAEKDAVQQAARELQRASDTVRDDIRHSPELFRNAPVATQWPARLQTLRASLDRAKDDLRQIDKTLDVPRAKQLLDEEIALRQTVVHDAGSIEADANNWLDFAKNLPHYTATMQRRYDQIHSADLAPAEEAVRKAEQDWPAKKPELENRLGALRQSREAAEAKWHATDAFRDHPAESQVATLIETNDLLEHTETPDDLRAACGQLYESWDKILADLELEHRGEETVYAEKVTTVRTHGTEVTSDTRTVEVAPAAYRAVENDLGMVIAHKDVGLFDSEATNKAQPPGFAYIAPPSVGSNQYGYWSHDGGQSVWTFLPQYLIMRELLWGHSYRPIVINEYNGYQMASRAGRTYYGQETPAAPPKYGSHGTFTTQRYASSRYVQSGGYSGSGYASSRSASPGFSQPRPASPPPAESSAGKRFGGSSGGQRFGGASPRSAPSPSAGRRFGGSRRR